MLKAQVLLLAALLLATNVLAGRISYSASYTNGDKTQRTQKLSNVPDDKDDLIVDNMQTWSDGKYTASVSRHNIVVVANVVGAASKGLASEQVQDMQ